VDAEGVTYQTITIGGQETRLFRCATHRADLSPEGCASRHLQARKRGDHDDSSGFTLCRTCHIGASHAGLERAMPAGPKRECVRCGQWSARLVWRLLCVGCYNRQQEVLKGRDRRGNVPRVHVRLFTGKPRERRQIDAVFRLTVMVNNRPEEYVAATILEALEQAVRTHHGETLTLAIPDAAKLFSQIPRT